MKYEPDLPFTKYMLGIEHTKKIFPKKVAELVKKEGNWKNKFLDKARKNVALFLALDHLFYFPSWAS